MSRKLFRKGILVFTVSSVMGSSTHMLADVTIGVTESYTDANTPFDRQYQHDASRAIEDVDAAGGISGKKIGLTGADSTYEPKQAVAMVNRLVDQGKAIVVIGHFCSSPTILASRVYDETKVIVITPDSTNPWVTERGLSGMFRMYNHNDRQDAAAGDYIVRVLKVKKVAMIHDKNIYGRDLVNTTRAQLSKLSAKEVFCEGLTCNEKGFNVLIARTHASGAEVVYFGGLYPGAGPLIRQVRGQGLTARFTSDDDVVIDELATITGGSRYVRDVLMTFGADPQLAPSSKTVVKRFRADGFEPEGCTLYSCASIQSLVAAFNGVGADDPAKTAEWLESHPAQTVMDRKE